MSIKPEKLGEFLEQLKMFPDRVERLQVLVSLGERFKPSVPPGIKKPYPLEHQVPGCESEVFMWATPQPDETLKYHFAVENPQGISAMALAVVIDDYLSGQPLEQVVEVPDEIVFEMFGPELSMGKGIGLINMLRMAVAFAKQSLREAGARA
jgi:cysteine desulfuration protein SufE